MGKRLYRVYMTTQDEIDVWAFNANQAKILAQAQNINEGKDYGVIKIVFIRY